MSDPGLVFKPRDEGGGVGAGLWDGDRGGDTIGKAWQFMALFLGFGHHMRRFF